MSTVTRPTHPTLSLGSTHGDVEYLQIVLNIALAPNSLKVDGDFGPATEAAVKKFQQNNNPLDVDGIVGPDTWGVLTRLG